MDEEGNKAPRSGELAELEALLSKALEKADSLNLHIVAAHIDTAKHDLVSSKQSKQKSVQDPAR